MRKDAPPGNDTTPKAFAETTPRQSDMPAYTHQVMFEMNNLLGRIESKIEHLNTNQQAMDKTLGSLGDRITALEHKASIVQGIMIAATTLIPICGLIVWWAVGQRIDQVLRPHAVETSTTQPAATSPQ